MIKGETSPIRQEQVKAVGGFAVIVLLVHEFVTTEVVDEEEELNKEHVELLSEVEEESNILKQITACRFEGATVCEKFSLTA